VRVSIWDDGVGGTALVVTLPLDQPEREQAVLSAWIRVRHEASVGASRPSSRCGWSQSSGMR
jgi:hypothetical protein